MAAAASLSGTATRMISQPASSSARICETVAATSCVFVLHIDWIATGYSPPIRTPPISTTFVSFLSNIYILQIINHIIQLMYPSKQSSPDLIRLVCIRLKIITREAGAPDCAICLPDHQWPRILATSLKHTSTITPIRSMNPAK